LYINQLPVTDKQKEADVFWVGLSAVAFSDDDERLPLSPYTRSGALVSEIEKACSNKISFYKTNLVKCLPLHRGKIRYPLQHEMEKCYHNFETELAVLEPKMVFLLGKQVASFIMQKKGVKSFQLDDDFSYQAYFIEGAWFVPVHHPSFVLVYKRRRINDYSRSISKLVANFLRACRRERKQVNIASLCD
jgi:DNA polymerase